MDRKLSSTAAVGVCALVLASCAGTELEETQDLRVRGDTFNSSLYEAYLARSQHEYDYGDYDSSDMFARRAQQAAAGQSVQPLPLDGDEFPTDEPGTVDRKQPEIGQAREDLLAVLDATARDKAPEAAAQAQAAYDCWLEETQPGHVEDCRGRFNTALRTAQDAVEADRQQQDQAAETAPAAPEEAESPAPDNYTLYFAFDSAQLSAEARDKLAQIVDAAEDRPQAEISATGFTDTAGPADYNQDLSFRRAQAVKEALSGRGLEADRISTAARGENRLAVETPDGVREPRNRRVEIQLF